ncbi:MAG: class I SAM-dependent methyltransferase [Spirochaetia bacterium]|jgi:ubiquinone/menaquinone biosynthesis C-methylase UbiE|nr:class I SAM-dependent methyltransferase [Spirochaetia bacterium]
MNERKRIIANHYEPLLSKYSRGYEILDWESLDSQIKRFEVLTGNVDLSGKKLLDVGCGTGDLFGYLKKQNINVDYYGIDILPAMVDRAYKIYPKGRFFAGDIFEETPFSKKQFDTIFCSGIFNLNMGDNETFFKEALPVFFAHAKESVVFNLLDPGHFVNTKKYYFFNTKEVLHLLREYTDEPKVVTGYIQNDFTIVAQVKKGDREPETENL